MGGPACSILVRSPPDHEMFSAVEAAVTRANWPTDAYLQARLEDPVVGADRIPEDELDLITNQLGWRPRGHVACFSAVNSETGHRLLGIGVQQIMKSLDGMVYLPYAMQHELNGVGTLHRIYQVGVFGTTFESWIVDSEWFDAWLEHPDFRLPK